jgi:iron complex transport system substrate-binding protein
MKQLRSRSRLAMCVVALAGAAAACGSGGSAGTTTVRPAAGTTSSTAGPGAGAFPVTLRAANGKIRIETRPHAIISLSPTATEMLYAIGAGSQVKAVDEYSDYPPSAPRTKLSGLQPNIEALVAYRPDLVLVAGDPTGLTGRLRSFGIPVLSLPAANTLRDVYRQIAELGEATGHSAQAASLAAQIRVKLAAIVKSTPKPAKPLTYYYELDPTYYTVTSTTFVGSLLALLGMRSIADAAHGADSGYPQLSAEYVIRADPDFIILADTVCCTQNERTVAARPGWNVITAVKDRNVVGLNDDVASRWGPRIVILLGEVAAAVRRADRHTSVPS